MEIVDYLLARKKAGGGSDVTIEQLSVTENGTYSEQGIAYSPVVVDVPAPENSYQLKDVPSGTVSTIEDGTDLPMSDLKVGIEPVQDLHGYDHPWAGGAGKNLFNKTQTFINDKYIDANGNIQNTTYGWEVSDYIPLKNNTNYYISGNNVTGASAYDALYDSDKNLVRTLGYSANAHNGAFTTDANEFYIRICTQESVVNNVQIEQGSIATSYEPYSNICPISGWTAANVTRTGKNLYFDKLENASITANGTFENNNSNDVYIARVKENEEYTFAANESGVTVGGYFTEKPSLSSATYNGARLYIGINMPQTVTIPQGVKYIAVRYLKTFTAPIIEKGTTITTYEPYSATTYNIQFRDGDNPLTVYGGTLDATSGELVVDRAEVDLGTLNWDIQSTGDYIGKLYSPSLYRIAKAYPNGVPNKVIFEEYQSKPSKAGGFYPNESNVISLNANGYLYIFSETAPTGQCVYELAEPITYHLTPTQVRTLVGNNNIWADTGNIIEGKYFKSLV